MMKYELLKTRPKELKTKEKIAVITFRKKQLYLVSDEMWKIIQEIQEKERFPFFAGLYLGDIIKGKYYPSISANKYLNLKKVVIKDEAVMRFTYGKNVSNYHIIKKEAGINEFVKIVNKNNEFLGYGILKEQGIKNIKDVGRYLRIEGD